MNNLSEFVIKNHKLTSYRGNSKEVVIPENVVEINSDTFSGHSEIERIVFPSGLRSIGQNTFAGCVSLEEVFLPDGFKELCEGAFANCDGLKEVRLPSSLEIWDWTAFDGCESLRLFRCEAGSYVRQIPDILGVPAVDFAGKPLPPILFQDDQWDYERVDDEICVNGRNDDSAGTLFQQAGFVTTMYIPAELEGLPVTRIGGDAFCFDCGMDALYLPDGLREIGSGAFFGCLFLRKIRVPDSLKTIGDFSFSDTGIPDDQIEKIDQLFENGYESFTDEEEDDEDEDVEENVESFRQETKENHPNMILLEGHPEVMINPNAEWLKAVDLEKLLRDVSGIALEHTPQSEVWISFDQKTKDEQKKLLSHTFSVSNEGMSFGWDSVEVTLDDHTSRYRISYIGPEAGALETTVQNLKDSEEADLTWMDEPGAYSWHFERRNDIVYMITPDEDKVFIRYQQLLKAVKRLC